ncbi:MAG: hypothetical protein WKG07_21455 [Hymenobacter sp.]
MQSAVDYYQKQVQKEARFYGGQLLHGAESIHDQYLHLLNLPPALLQVITEDNEREARRSPARALRPAGTARLFENAAFAKLRENEQLLQTTIRRKLQWDDAEELEALREAWQKEMQARRNRAGLPGRQRTRAWSKRTTKPTWSCCATSTRSSYSRARPYPASWKATT